MSGFIFDLEELAIRGAIQGALQPFVAAGDTTEAKATEMADAVTDALSMLDASAKKPPVDPGAVG
jgi:hypothetical protein